MRHSFAWTAIGNILYSLCNWAMLAVVAKLGTLRMVGQFSLGIAVTQPIFILVSFSLGNVLISDVHQEHAFGDYLGLRLIANAFGLLLTLLIALLMHRAADTFWVIVITGVGAAFDLISALTYGFLGQKERLSRVGISLTIKGVLSLAGVVAGMMLLHSVVWAAAGSALASAIGVFGYDLSSARILLQNTAAQSSDAPSPHRRIPITVTWSLRDLRRLAWLSLPVGLAQMLIALTNNVPRYYLLHYRGEAEVGIFSALAAFVSIGRTVMVALDQAARPRLARYFSQRDRRAFCGLLWKLVLVSGLLGVCIPLAALAFGRLVLRLFYTPQYADHLDVLFICLAAGGIGYVASFLVYALTAARHFKVQVPYMACVTAVVVLMGWIWIPRSGLRGAAFSMLAAMVVQLIGGVVLVHRALRTLPRRDSVA